MYKNISLVSDINVVLTCRTQSCSKCSKHSSDSVVYLLGIEVRSVTKALTRELGCSFCCQRAYMGWPT